MHASENLAGKKAYTFIYNDSRIIYGGRRNDEKNTKKVLTANFKTTPDYYQAQLSQFLNGKIA